MTLPASGTISMAQVNTELSKASNAIISLNDTAVRTLFAKPSGAIAMSDGWGKSSYSGQTPAWNSTATINAYLSGGDNCYDTPSIDIFANGSIGGSYYTSYTGPSRWVPNLVTGEGAQHEIRIYRNEVVDATWGYHVLSYTGGSNTTKSIGWTPWYIIGASGANIMIGWECTGITYSGTVEIRNKNTLATISKTYTLAQ